MKTTTALLRAPLVLALLFGTFASPALSFQDATELIDISIWDEDGEMTHGFRYHGVGTHRYRDQQVAGEFKDGRYTCTFPSGPKAVEIWFDNGIRVEAFDEEGTLVERLTSKGLAPAYHPDNEVSFAVEDNTVRFWWPEGEKRAELVLCNDIWEAWGWPNYDQAWAEYYREEQERFCRKVIRHLRKGLGHSDPWVRAYVAQALWDLAPASRRAVPELIQALEDDSWVVRLWAARALGDMEEDGEAAAAALLVSARNAEEHVAVRQAALEAIAQLEAPGAVDELLPVMRLLVGASDLPEELRTGAAGVLRSMGPRAFDATPELAAIARGNDPCLAVDGLRALWHVNRAELDVVRGLVDALHEDEARISAAHALKELGPAAASAGEDLRQAYQQYSSLVDHAADAYALAGALKAVVPDAPELAGWLLPGRSADYRRVSMFTIFALCMVDATPTAATERLIEMLGSEDYTERSAPRRHLRNVGPEAAAAIPALIHMLGDNNIPLREWACEALGQIGPAAIPALLEALEDDRYLRRWSAPEALGYIGRPAVPALVRALDSEEGPVVAAALQAVGALGPEAEEALPTLRHMTRSHPKSHVRQLSALVIEKIATR